MSRVTLAVPTWAKRLERIPEEALQGSMAYARSVLRDNLHKNASKGGPRGLNVRTGRGIRSIRTYLKGQGSDMELSAGMNFYMWVHNRGAVIVPKNGPFLRFQLPGGQWISTRRVVLPAREWVDDAVQSTRQVFWPTFRSQVRKAMS